jgi:hypothetical protein
VNARPFFPWVGGAGNAAPIVWDYLGVPTTLTVWFGGALGEIFACPDHVWRAIKHVTINELEPLLLNALRAIARGPGGVATVIDRFSPLAECDLHAARRVVLDRREDLRVRLEADLDFCDVELAGLWLAAWSMWIGDYKGFVEKTGRQLPAISSAGRGVLSPSRDILAEFRAFAAKLQVHPAALTCGDWSRVQGDSVLWRCRESGGGGYGIGAVIADPPFADTENVYPDAEPGIAVKVRERLREFGGRENFRAVLAGYDDEHDALLKDGWRRVEHDAAGLGYKATGKKPKKRVHVLWVSPHCVEPGPRTQFKSPTGPLLEAVPS